MLSRIPGPGRERGTGTVVLVASGLLGGSAGLMHATWQWAVEIAQVDAGLVAYPPDSLMRLIHGGIWSLVPQVIAPALAAGMSERTASALVSGLLGAASFQALAMVVVAAARRVWIAVLTPLLVFVTGAAMHGVTYPIFLAGTSHTFGAAGLSVAVLTFGLLASGHARAGGLLLGIAPAVHLTSGAWAMACVIAVALFDRRTRPLLAPALRPALAGIAVTLGSLALHVSSGPHVPSGAPEVSRQYLETFVRYWDGHRIPASWRAPGSIFTMAALVVSAIWLRGGRDHLADGSRLLLSLVVVSSAAGLAASTLSWLPATSLPAPILIAMPARFLNVSAMMFAALLVGLLASVPHRRSGGIALAIFAAALLLTRQSALVAVLAAWQPWWTGRGISQGAVLLATAAGLTIWAVTRGGARGPEATSRASPRPGHSRGLVRIVAIGLSVCIGAPLAWTLARNTQGLQHAGLPLWDRADDRVLATTGARPGLLLHSGSLWLAQARTRRPILFDLFTIDGLPYALGAAPAANALLGEVYGLDLLAPPPDANTDGHVRASRAAWETFTRDRWQRIRRAYGVTDVLTHADWRLDLPIVAASPRLLLYGIPE